MTGLINSHPLSRHNISIACPEAVLVILCNPAINKALTVLFIIPLYISTAAISGKTQAYWHISIQAQRQMSGPLC